MEGEQDFRDFIFEPVKDKKYRAVIVAEEAGILSGTRYLEQTCTAVGITALACREDGSRVKKSDVIVTIEGSAKQIALAEEQLIGWISKASGIATAASRARASAGKTISVVSGAWKKMPHPMKELVRQAISHGGLQYRIVKPPFIYLDKNYVKILGGVQKALRWANRSRDTMTVIVQLKSKGQKLASEALLAARMGADIIMIDTGRRADIDKVDIVLRKERIRDRVRVAFGGNIKIEDLRGLKKKPVDIVDIGRAIVDAPLLDMRIDVLRKV